MATIKIKFRKSSIKGKAGTIYYQICHKQNNKSITTKIHILPYQWNSEKQQLNITPEEEAVLRKYQRQIDNDIALLKRIIKELDKRGGKYSLSDIASLFHSPGTQTTIMPYTFIVDFSYNTIRTDKYDHINIFFLSIQIV